MSKHIKKYSVFAFTIILSLMFGYVAFAEGGESERPSNGKEIKKEMESVREQVRTENEQRKEEIKAEREEARNRVEQMLQSIKEDREELKDEMKTNREQVKEKLTEMKKNFLASIQVIKDENKKLTAERIVDSIHDLNIRLTDSLSEKVNQIETVLVSVESRIDKAKENGIDVTLAITEVEKTKEAIATARGTIASQAAKIYQVSITDEASLKQVMKNLRDLFNEDIKLVKEKVKLAHEALRNTATTLAKIPNVDQAEIEEEVENEDETNTNNQ